MNDNKIISSYPDSWDHGATAESDGWTHHIWVLFEQEMTKQSMILSEHEVLMKIDINREWFKSER